MFLSPSLFLLDIFSVLRERAHHAYIKHCIWSPSVGILGTPLRAGGQPSCWRPWGQTGAQVSPAGTSSCRDLIRAGGLVRRRSSHFSEPLLRYFRSEKKGSYFTYSTFRFSGCKSILSCFYVLGLCLESLKFF